jgi:hypothetical protein
LSLEPDLAEGSNASFSEWRRRRQPMCQMPGPSARIVRCPPRPNWLFSDAHGPALVLSAWR